LSSAVIAPATGAIYDLKGARLTKEHVISILQERDVPIQGAFIRGGLRPITQIAAIALRYSIKTHRSLPDDRVEVVGLDGELMFVVKGFALDEWNYSWGNDNEAVEEEAVAAVEQQQAAQQEPAPAKWSRKKGEKSEKRLAIEAALQNGVTIPELMEEYGHTRAYFWSIAKEIGVTLPSQRGKWKRKPRLSEAEEQRRSFAAGNLAADKGKSYEETRKLVDQVANAEEQARSRFDRSMEAMKPCSIPPEGWYCTRKAGHEGPCAAKPRNKEFLASKPKPLRVDQVKPTEDKTLERLRKHELLKNTPKLGWRGRFGNLLRSVANRVEGSNA
jgi:transposase-like protein